MNRFAIAALFVKNFFINKAVTLKGVKIFFMIDTIVDYSVLAVR